MARKTLTVRGRVIAAGASIAVAAGLGGFMAARDHTAEATQPSSSSTRTDGFGTATPSSGTNATPFPRDDQGGADGSSAGTSQLPPQPQTRTGGS